MKRKIVVEYGEVRRIARLMNCTPEFVSRSLSFGKDTQLAKAVRKMALMRGGIEIGDETVQTINQ